MITFRTACPSCGVVEVSEELLWLTDQDHDGSAAYRFLCPGCGRANDGSVGSSAGRLLKAMGVRFSVETIAASITEEEIAAFRSGLEGDWRTRLAVDERRSG